MERPWRFFEPMTPLSNSVGSTLTARASRYRHAKTVSEIPFRRSVQIVVVLVGAIRGDIRPRLVGQIGANSGDLIPDVLGLWLGVISISLRHFVTPRARCPNLGAWAQLGANRAPSCLYSRNSSRAAMRGGDQSRSDSTQPIDSTAGP